MHVAYYQHLQVSTIIHLGGLDDWNSLNCSEGKAEQMTRKLEYHTPWRPDNETGPTMLKVKAFLEEVIFQATQPNADDGLPQSIPDGGAPMHHDSLLISYPSHHHDLGTTAQNTTATDGRRRAGDNSNVPMQTQGMADAVLSCSGTWPSQLPSTSINYTGFWDASLVSQNSYHPAGLNAVEQYSAVESSPFALTSDQSSSQVYPQHALHDDNVTTYGDYLPYDS